MLLPIKRILTYTSFCEMTCLRKESHMASLLVRLVRKLLLKLSFQDLSNSLDPWIALCCYFAKLVYEDGAVVCTYDTVLI